MKPIGYYMSLPYTIKLIECLSGYVVIVEELPGCLSQGDTKQEAIEMIEDAMRGWFLIAMDDDMEIPEP